MSSRPSTSSIVQGSAETIDTKSRTDRAGRDRRAISDESLSYDRLVVATGSRLFRPNIPGLARARLQRRQSRRCDRARPASAWPGRSAGIERTRHHRRSRRRLHGNRGGDRNAGAASRDPRQGRPAARHHRRTKRVRSLPIWARVPVPSSRRRCASSAWRPGSVPALPRWIHPASRCPTANVSRPRP